MFVVSPTTIWNASALETRSAPKTLIGRMTVLPRVGGSFRLWLRILFESQIFRFSAALSPFVVAIFVWPDLALPIAQAPIAMLIVVGIVEMRVLRVKDENRAKLATADEAGRALDALRFRGERALSKLAARRGLQSGELMLVVEQSELARVAPLTFVSVQVGGAAPEVLPLDAEERAILHETLFAEGFTEAALHRANLRENRFLRTVTLEARAVSAHARMAALMAAAGR